MGDMGDDFRAWREHKQKRKGISLQKNMDFLNSIEADYEVFNNGYQLNFILADGNTVSFYPSTNKWVLLGKSFFGTAENFMNWMKKQNKENS